MIPWFRYLANLHEYGIERLSSFTKFCTAEVPMHFPCGSIEHHLICFLQLSLCRISTPAMPTQTWPRPTCGDGAAKKRSTTATPTSARGVAAEGATCLDGHSKEDVHNGDDSERWPRLVPGTASGRGRRRKLPPSALAAPAPAASSPGHGRPKILY